MEKLGCFRKSEGPSGPRQGRDKKKEKKKKKIVREVRNAVVQADQPQTCINNRGEARAFQLGRFHYYNNMTDKT